MSESRGGSHGISVMLLVSVTNFGHVGISVLLEYQFQWNISGMLGTRHVGISLLMISLRGTRHHTGKERI